MSEKQIRLCMIGAGQHSEAMIYPSFRFLTGAEVVANADINEERAKNLATQFGVPRTYTDYHAMLDAEKPDGVMICVSADFHARTAIELMEQGYHVYTEKPNAVSLAQSEQVLAVQRRTGKICMVGYKKRFGLAYRKAKQYIDSAEFGSPSLLSMTRTHGHDPANDDRHGDYLLYWGCHALDLMTYLFGPVAKVHAFSPQGTSDSYAISFYYVNSAVGTMNISNRPGRRVEAVHAIGSSLASIHIDNAIFMDAYKNEMPVLLHKPCLTSGFTHMEIEEGFVAELQEFIDAIREGREPEANIAQATHTMAVYEAILRSIESGDTIELEAI